MKLGALDWSQTPVKMEDGQLQTKRGITSGTDIVENQWKAAAVGQYATVWLMHIDRK